MKLSHARPLRYSRLLGAALVLAATPLFGVNYTAGWKSAVSGSWYDATKWSNAGTGAYPSNGVNTYDVGISVTGSPYSVSGGATVSNFSLSSASATLFASGLIVTGSLNISAGGYSGSIQSGTVNISGGSVSASNISASGSVSVNGGSLNGGSLGAASLTFSGGATSMGGGGTVNVTGALTATSGSYGQNGGSLQAASALVNGAALTLTNTTFATTGALQISSGSLGVIGGSFTPGSLFQNGGSLTLGNGGNVTGSTQIPGGTLTLSGGTLTTSSPALSGGTLALNGGTFVANGGLQVLGGSFLQNGGTLQTTSILLNGGSIVGGTLDPALVTFGNNNGSGLDGVQITGDLQLSQAGGRVRLRNGSSFAGAGYLSGSSNILYYEATAAQPASNLARTVNLTGYNPIVSLEGPASVLNVASAGIVRGAGLLTHSQLAPVAGGSTVQNQGLFSADVSGQTLSLSSHVFNNASGGLVRAVSGGTLVVSPTTSFNNLAGGTVSATGNSTVTLQKNWHNSGSLVLQDNSVLNLQGSFTIADLGLSGWARTGGTVNLGGTLNNAGTTLALDAASGNFVLAGGVINGGSVVNTAAGRLTLNNSNANALDGATVSGSLNLDQNGSRVRMRNDAAVTGAITLSDYFNILAFEATAQDPTASLANTVNLAGTNSILSLDGPSPVLAVAPTGILRGFGSVSNGYLAGFTGQTTLNNQGTVSADTAGLSLIVGSHLLNNTGTLEAKNGGILTINTTNFSNSGGNVTLSGNSTVNLQGTWHLQGGAVNLQGNSTLNLEGGFTTADLGLAGWTRAGGSMAKLLGALDNTGATITLTSATGPLMLAGGTIKGGILTSTGGNFLANGVFTNALDAVTVAGNLVLDQYQGRVRLRNDATFSGSANLINQYNTLSFEGTATDSTANLSGTINLDGYASTVSVDGVSPTFTIAPSGTIRGSGTLTQSGGGVSLTGTSSVINQGLISADISGQTLLLNVPNFTNQGILEAKNGAVLSMPAALAGLTVGKVRLAGGFLQVNSSVTGPDFSIGAAARLEGFGEVRFNNAVTDSLSLAGALDPSSGAGGLIIKGDLIPAATATLAFDVAGSAQGTGYDFVSEAGNTPLNLAGSTLKVTLGRGYRPTNAQTFTLLSSSQAITGAFGNVASGARLTTSDGYGSFVVTYTGSSVVLGGFQLTPQAAFLTYMDAAFPGGTDPAVVGPNADPDGDGVPNWLEFARKGDPASPASAGLAAALLRDVNPAPGAEFTYVIACRAGAVFTAQPGGSQATTAAVDAASYTIEASADLKTYPLAVLHQGPSFTPPAGAGLPDLTGTGWEYHSFYVDPAVAGPRLFLRLRATWLP